MKTLLLDVFNEKVEAVDIEPELDEYYRLLQCDLIDIPTRYIGGKPFDIICDDEGLLKENPKVSAINKNWGAMLVGNLLFVHHDENGEPYGLTDEEITYLKSYIMDGYTARYPRPYPMLTQCEFFN